MQGSKKKMPFSVDSIKVHCVMAEIDEFFFFFAVLVLGRSTIQKVDDGFAIFLIRNVTRTNELLMNQTIRFSSPSSLK